MRERGRTIELMAHETPLLESYRVKQWLRRVGLIKDWHLLKIKFALKIYSQNENLHRVESICTSCLEQNFWPLVVVRK